MFPKYARKTIDKILSSTMNYEESGMILLLMLNGQEKKMVILNSGLMENLYIII